MNMCVHLKELIQLGPLLFLEMTFSKVALDWYLEMWIYGRFLPFPELVRVAHSA